METATEEELAISFQPRLAARHTSHLQISWSLSEDLHDGKSQPTANEHFADPKQTPIPGASQIRGSVVKIHSVHQSAKNSKESRQDALSQDSAGRMRVHGFPIVALSDWFWYFSCKVHANLTES
jgi:hypothetical protein